MLGTVYLSPSRLSKLQNGILAKFNRLYGVGFYERFDSNGFAFHNIDNKIQLRKIAETRDKLDERIKLVRLVSGNELSEGLEELYMSHRGAKTGKCVICNNIKDVARRQRIETIRMAMEQHQLNFVLANNGIIILCDKGKHLRVDYVRIFYSDEDPS